MVSLRGIGSFLSLSLWSHWEDESHEDVYVVSWPSIVGSIKKEEIALVLEVSFSDTGEIGAKIYTQNNAIGWICINQIKKIKLRS